MNLEKVSEHVYYVQGPAGVATDNEGFISNAVAVISNKGIIVIDSLGTPSLAALFLEKLKAITVQPVVKVIVTHYHADHIYGLQVFKEQGASIIAPAGYSDYLEGPNAQQRLEERRFSLEPWVNDDTYLVIPDEVIDKNTAFTLGDIDIEINYLGSAHSDGDLTVFVKQDNVLITGDIIFEGRVPFTGSADTGHWLSLLEKLKTKNIVALVPGHGGAAKDPNAAIQLTLRYLQQVRAIMKAAVDELMPFAEAYEEAVCLNLKNYPLLTLLIAAMPMGSIYLSNVRC
ncbi:MBL fold metallo-hydrolase [sulfur-oxidizing endosymbiont of Gigantopelta aegis]|uniref:MBL fold metallo-hydrolase n=1 Tax=sulfur-oxidizing endosymbiont of Gigantopelta aegis TaxID=2794934 RepID=UPI0018DDA43D|nr:MBL fold metallo-hydrolase [sulfur-oxidizing endosymbiont of Gigantopelta aegis]